MRIFLFAAVGIAACASPSAVEIELSPTVISSLAGTTNVTALLVDENATPVADQSVHVAITYTDRYGATHDIPAVDGKTNARGVFETAITGLTWEGTGKVDVTSGAKASGSATFAVLDRTPPKVTILPPTTNLHVGPGLPLDVQVHVTDEIGVAMVSLDTSAAGGGQTRLLASGSTDATVTFRIDVPTGAPNGSTITLYALAQDLSENRAAAAPVTLTIDTSITIATPPPLMGMMIADGTTSQLVNPRGIVFSSKDGHLYVSDQANTGTCTPSCIWRVDASTGMVDSTPVVTGAGNIEGLALDATADNLYFSDSQNRTAKLTWNGTQYATSTTCNNTGSQLPQDPFGIVFDATLGILVVDGNQKEVIQIATCSSGTNGTQLTTNSNFDAPRGIAAGAAGEFYVSDNNRDEVSKMTSTGTLTLFQRDIGGPLGMRWLGTSAATQFANSLLVAASGDRTITSTRGAGTLSAAYLRNSPFDLTLDGAGAMYIVTGPSAGNRGRIYKVTGF